MDRGVTAIILAAGYGTRLEKEIRNEGGEFTHLIGIPKPLLPVNDKPLIDFWISQLNKIDFVKNIFVITNGLFFDQFKRWCETTSFPIENVVNDQSMTNDTRLGAIADINLVLESKKEQIGDSDVFVIAGDTLLYPDFDLRGFLAKNYEKGSTVGIVCNKVKDEEVHKRGIIEVDENMNVLKFLEKPQSTETTSRYAVPALYYYPNSFLSKVNDFIEEKKDAPREQRDAPGGLVVWTVQNHLYPVQATLISGRFDIGGLKEYKFTLDYFKNLSN